jgi:hypothetical protein
MKDFNMRAYIDIINEGFAETKSIIDMSPIVTKIIRKPEKLHDTPGHESWSPPNKDPISLPKNNLHSKDKDSDDMFDFWKKLKL